MPHAVPRAAMTAIALDAATAAAWLEAAIVLDAREPAAFAEGHLPGAGRMTGAEFASRRPELPPRHARVLVVHDRPALAREAAEQLAGMDYRRVGWLAVPLAGLPGGHASREAAARLWRPSPFVERMRPRLSPGRA